MRVITAALALCLAPSMLLNAQQPYTGPAVVQTVAVAPGASVTVTLGRGDVRVRPGPAGQVRVTLRALPGSGGPTPPVSRLAAVEQSPHGVHVTGTREHAVGNGVAAVIEVPHGSSVRVRLERGDIRVTGLTGSLLASTARGDVVLDAVDGSANVDVTNGNVTASFSRLDATTPSAFVTLNGNVVLKLPRSARADLDVRCRGCTLRDLLPGVELDRTRLLGRSPDAVILAAAGPLRGGGARLRILTWDGEVSIAR